jgi:two-component system response regulator PilR (NtrC family)
MVVDDELSMREYLEVLLSRLGHEVVTAANVGDARAVLAKGGLDLVVSDMKLGNGSGMEVLRATRAQPHSPEVILITAFGTPAAAVEAMREGAYDYICKPFDNEELTLLVGKALEKRRLLQENSELKKSLTGPDALPWVGVSPAILGTGGEGGRHAFYRPDHRRERDRQGARSSGHSSEGTQCDGPVPRAQLRCAG